MNFPWPQKGMTAVLAFVSLLAGCATDKSPTAAVTTQRNASVVVLQQRQFSVHGVPINATNDCTGQQIAVVADIHLASFTFVDDSGQLHDQFTLNIHATGTDAATGINYIANQIVSATTQLTAGADNTVAITFTLLGQGAAPDQRTRWKLHFTVDANGVVTVDFDRLALIGDGCPN